MPTYATRLKAAREHRGLSQTDLALALNIKPQAIQYLENPNKKARGSKHTAGIARVCGVDANWLASGDGRMLANMAREPAAAYDALSDDARQIASAWSRLSSEHQQWIKELIYLFATVNQRFPWLRRGRPKSETYNAYERRMEENYHATVVKAAERLKPQP